MDLRISNITCVFKLGCELDLQRITNRYNKLCRYNKQRFVGLVMRLKAPKVTLLIHRTGSVTALGCASIRKINYAIQKLCRMFNCLNYHCNPTSPEIRNIVCCGRFPFELRPMPKLVQYEPELFPGMHYRRGRACATMFHNGNINITGITTLSEAEKIAKFLLDAIKLYKQGVPLVDIEKWIKENSL